MGGDTDGIDFFKTAENTFFTINQQDLIAQLFNIKNTQLSSFVTLDSVVKGLMETSSPRQITRFLTDYNAVYKSLSQQIPIVHIDQQFPRELSGADNANVFAVFFAFIFVSIRV